MLTLPTRLQDLKRRREQGAETIEVVITVAVLAAAVVNEQWNGCERTLAKAIGIEPRDEELWRMRILAAHARRDQPAVDETIARLYAQLDALMGGDATLEDESALFLERLRAGATVNDLLEMI